VVREAIALSCDAEPGDIILIVPREPRWDRGRAIHPYGFGYSTAIADIFDWEKLPIQSVPRIMKARDKWEKALNLGADGNLHWQKPVLSGFPVLAKLPVKPGSIIYLRGTLRGLVRIEEEYLVDGVNPIKRNKNKGGCIFREKELKGPLAPIVFPDLFSFRK